MPAGEQKTKEKPYFFNHLEKNALRHYWKKILLNFLKLVLNILLFV
jgi:hypothetical protein